MKKNEIKLDKNCVYDLSRLTIEELKAVAKETDYLKGWNEFVKDSKIYLLYFEHEDNNWVLNYAGIDFKYTKVNAKELFYTLENVQVDCRNETEERIKEMACVFESNGIPTDFNDLDKTSDCYYLHKGDNLCFVRNKDKDKDKPYTITYEKFMELFGNKEKSQEFKNLVEVLNEDLTEEAYKETEYEVKYIAEKPKQYQIGIDTFERCEANMTKEEILACVKFGIDKYVWRNKGQDLEDLEKIIDYANWGIKQLKRQ